jgi:hypothetical protein
MNVKMLARLVALALLLGTASLAAAEDSNTELAKKSQNPVADLISIPLQDNIGFGYGPKNDVQNVLNIQPVIPVSLNKEWNLITRTILPIIAQPWPEAEFGLGDLNATAFLSPAAPGKLIWGVGPVLQFPTATDRLLGSGKWCAGGAAVALLMEGPWVVGGLLNNIWSYAGNGDRRSVNQMLFQPFINYNLPDAWYVTFSPIITGNWMAAGENVWTVPLGGGFGKIFRIGKLPFNGQLSAYANVAKPEVGPDWTLRVQLAILLPKSIL